ncbi:aminopeptidase N [Tribolium madens]|uniref:aminopeptidase N n=1 Tax=Tribolium madens TaxID=41895 RepID=UPI001CF74018|nr:aminopeptidase N [Tribolium madens]
MTHAREDFAVMEATVTTFGKQKFVAVSKALALFIFILFLGCIVATGLLVYHLSSCQPISKFEETTLIVYDKHSDLEVTTTSEEVVTESVVTTTEEIKTEFEDVRLPKSIKPHSYTIRLIPFIFEGNFTFHGEVTILINVTVTSLNITLHADDLDIDHVNVYDLNNKLLSIRQVSNETRRQFLIIHLNEPVKSGHQYYVSIKFRGVLNDLLQGFYRSSYKVNNEIRWIATTQFQATDARKAFPCFDEPALKARFQISLARLGNMTSISNMPKIGNPEPVKNLPGYLWDHYEESVPMSTYLIAFVISDFECHKNGTFSVWVRRSALSQTKYSLQVGPQILQFYENFFGIKYPLPKIDMIGLPDFSAGAMENWGLITYRESVLLYEEKVSSKGSLQRIAHVIAHELAHQWFGNLVTPVWWSDLWLNEGFATYVECLGANAVNPHLKELDQFVINELHGAFVLDALKTSHQISIKVNNPDEINDIFDRISYSKGASILRMMQHFLSMPVFQKGLNGYLKSQMYKNAEQDDLWHSLTLQSHEDKVLDQNVTIKEIMDTWTLQTGFPLVTAHRNYENGSVTFTQERFLITDDNKSAKSVLWWIPITYTNSKNVVISNWMRNEPFLTIYNLNQSKNDWLLVNVNQTGYYRVNYDQRNWNLIIQQLLKKNGHLVFDPKNRAQLLDDALHLASVGYLDYNIALNVTKYLKQEREYVPWKAALTSLDFMYQMFVRTAHFDKFKKYLLDLVNDFYHELGFNENENDQHLTFYNRFEINSRACKLGVHDCIINAVQQFETWRNSPDPDKRNLISANLREIVYCAAISVGGQEEWDFAWKRYLNANVENEKEILLMALGCSKEIWILSRYLEWAITENSGIRKHDSARVFAAVASNPIGQQLAYRFLKTHWNRLRTYLGTSSMSLSIIVRSCTAKFNSQIEIDDFKLFVDTRENEFGVALRTARQSIEQGEANVKWMMRHSEKIFEWLSANV